MTEITFVNILSKCDIDGHIMMPKSMSEPRQYLYESVEICVRCKLERTYQQYKYMPKQEILDKK